MVICNKMFITWYVLTDRFHFILSFFFLISQDPEKIHLLWLRILTHFILLSNSLQVLNELKVAPTILGTMSAYRRSAEIQQYGCTALSIFATVRPTPTSKVSRICRKSKEKKERKENSIFVIM